MQPLQLTREEATQAIEHSKSEIARHTRIKRHLTQYIKQLSTLDQLIGEENKKTDQVIKKSPNHTRAKS